MTKSLTVVMLLLYFAIGCGQQPELNPEQGYLSAWKKFYPSQALDQGIHTSIFEFEDFSQPNIDRWITFNEQVLQQIVDSTTYYVLENPIDARLLSTQIKGELDKWQIKAEHQYSLSLYERLIAKATSKVLEADFLTDLEKSQWICRRLQSVQQLCVAARQNLKHLDPMALDQGLKNLAEAQDHYTYELPKWIQEKELVMPCENFQDLCQKTASEIQSLVDHVNSAGLTSKSITRRQILGKEEYTRQLSLYTDSSLSPDALSEMALQEIEVTRNLMGEVAGEYLKTQYPDQPIPEDFQAMVQKALDDMEKDAPKDGRQYLEFWRELSDAAAKFVEENHIATLPEFPTLRFLPAPESAGPNARIGWVENAPPFAPNPLTTLYLPNIPDTLPEQERIDFWASFNKPFNRMIVIHELFPGHYMQDKISRESPHPVRLLFPFGPYAEGWATFTEKVALDAGWEKGNHLTLLAHLRKRLENANRAYTSVQVHCNGWDQEEVMRFSTETSLLAPQFAKSLWYRLMSSPMQLTSYFWGGKQFSDLLTAEKKRLGDKFNLQIFMDTILKVGPIPIEEFYDIFNPQ